MTAQPISGVTAPDKLPITVFNVYLLFVQNVYKTTYVNQPINAYANASKEVKNKITCPIIVARIPNNNTVDICKFPVTVGRFCVRSIFSSKSTSYQLLNINAPETTSVLPMSMQINVSQTSKKLTFVNDKAIQKVATIGKTFATSTFPFVKYFNSVMMPFKLLMFCLSTLHSVEKLIQSTSLNINVPILELLYHAKGLVSNKRFITCMIFSKSVTTFQQHHRIVNRIHEGVVVTCNINISLC